MLNRINTVIDTLEIKLVILCLTFLAAHKAFFFSSIMACNHTANIIRRRVVIKVQLSYGFGGIRDRFDPIIPPVQPYLKAPSIILRIAMIVTPIGRDLGAPSKLQVC
jgi:hypothetical protein